MAEKLWTTGRHLIPKPDTVNPPVAEPVRLRFLKPECATASPGRVMFLTPWIAAFEGLLDEGLGKRNVRLFVQSIEDRDS